MSLSTLQAQLAALHHHRSSPSAEAGGGRHPGSAPPASRRHGDAVGRGAGFSVQTGQAAAGGGGATKRRATLLHESRRVAADTPLRALREDAEEALRVLSAIHPPLASLGAQLLLGEGGGAGAAGPENGKAEAAATAIRRVLAALGSLLGEADVAVDENCLRVLEYLLRRHGVHERFAEDLLWTFLPHGDRLPGPFRRCLRLVDLTSNRSYLWLRPYAADEGCGGGGAPPRRELAMRAARRTDLLGAVCRVAGLQADLHRREAAAATGGGAPLSPRRGIAHNLSFTAAVVVEGLSWLSRQERDDDDRRHGEAVLRTLLPATLRACRRCTTATTTAAAAHCTDWTGWGYVVASAMAETMDLAQRTVSLLTTTIITACTADQSLDERADALACVLSILLPPREQQRTAVRDDEEAQRSYLPLLCGRMLGCPLPADTYEALCSGSLGDLPGALGHLHAERRLVVAPLLASIVRRGLASSNGDLVSALLREGALDPVWNDPRLDLTASLAAHVTRRCLCPPADDGEREEGAPSVELGRGLLLRMRERDRAACERGIAHAIRAAGGTDRLRDRASRLLEDIVPADADGGPDEEQRRDPWRLLPLRVAVQHADASVRRQAIDRLVAAVENGQEEVDSSLCETFLRLWGGDPDNEVALAASRAFGSWLARTDPIVTEHSATRVCELALRACYRCFNESVLHQQRQSTPDKKVHCQLLVEGLKILGRVALDVARLGRPELTSLYQRSLILLCAHLDSDDESLSTQAARSLLVSLDHVADRKSEEVNPTLAKEIVLQNMEFLEGLLKQYSSLMRRGLRDPEAILCLRCVRLILNEIVGHLEDVKELQEYALSLSLTVLKTQGSAQLKDQECEMLRKCLGKSLASFSGSGDRVPELLAVLASVESDRLYSKVAEPCIEVLAEKVLDSDGKSVSLFTVLLEAAAQPNTSAEAAIKLVSRAEAFAAADYGEAPWLCVVQSLALLESRDERLRIASVDLLKAIGSLLPPPPRQKNKRTLDWSCLKIVCTKVSSVKSSAAVGGSTFLSNFLGSCVRESPDSAALQEVLLSLCIFSATSCGRDSGGKLADVARRGWLSLGSAVGGSWAATVVLDAMELAGEAAFPLASRWKYAGRPLLDVVLAENVSETIPPCLLRCIARMLKGVTVSDPQVIVSSGPSTGAGRARSYSIGTMDGVTVLSPYPKDMADAILEIISKTDNSPAARVLASVVAKEVLASRLWGEEVYGKLPRASRKRVASSVLDYASSDYADMPEAIIASLPFNETDLADLLGSAGKDENLTKESILVECICSNAESLAKSSGAFSLVTLLFEHLERFLSNTREDLDGVDYIMQTILSALNRLFEFASYSGRTTTLDKKKLEVWSQVLLKLVEGSDREAALQQASTTRVRLSALSLLSSLCAKYPQEIVASLIPAALSVVVASDGKSQVARMSQTTFSTMIPVYWQHASAAGFTLTHFLSEFIVSVKRLPTQKEQERLYLDLARALASSASPEEPFSEKCSSPGALVAFFLAGEVFLERGHLLSPNEMGFVEKILTKIPVFAQISSLSLLLRYVEQLFALLEGIEDTATQPGDEPKFLPTSIELALLTASGSPSNKKICFRKNDGDCRESILSLAQALLQAFGSALVQESIRKCLRKADCSISNISLQLWQGLLRVKSAAMVAKSGEPGDNEEQLLESILNLSNESREYLQDVLPTPVFLASVGTLIQEGGTSEVRARALRLVADKVLALEAGSQEVRLFLELLPVILEVLPSGQGTVSETSHDLILRQAALVAIEHIAQAFHVHLCEMDREKSFGEYDNFCKVLRHCSDLIEEYAHGADDEAHELVCSAALCAATTIRVVGPRCLPLLPRLMKPLATLLATSNAQALSSNGKDEYLTFARMTQLSVLRALVSVVETVPQFLPAYFASLLSDSAVLSGGLRDVSRRDDFPIEATLDRFDNALTTRVAPRLLIPAATKAFSECSRPGELRVLLSILRASVDQASSREVASQKSALLETATKAFGYEGICEDRFCLIDRTCTLLEGVVLKLSEVQLRRMFFFLREWRGELDKTNPEKNATKRYAFWSLSARLSKQLRSIFLPCLSMVVDEAVAELELAASRWCKPRLAEKRGQKKRRLESDNAIETTYGIEAMRVVQPLLLCLENSLRVDAHEGGNWVRADENQKYESLLDPLGKLLLSRVPPEFPAPESATSNFEYIIEGSSVEDGGSVVSCLTSLALAGGNEQLWKPLNHAVVQACGDEGRSEVRKAGLVCLLALMNTLGEEYMVLLPENLPILAELLEDSNEEVAGLAREVVTLAEDLIGESLEDSLR